MHYAIGAVRGGGGPVPWAKKDLVSGDLVVWLYLLNQPTVSWENQY